MSQVPFAASKESSTENYIDIMDRRHDLLINLITKARELEVSSTIRELLIDYLQVDILSHHLAQDNYNKIIASPEKQSSTKFQGF